ncbi:putative O-methyltransferase [Xylaria sp. CBS 124048]|nr:putative O-methyltransferase [Xylaria sp. CBS 124048]
MSTQQSRIAQLASVVASSTQRIDEYLAQNALPYPSFDSKGPTDLGLPPALDELRLAALEATQELNDLLQGPRNLIYNHRHNQLVHLSLIYRFGIAKLVPIDGELSFGDLASKIGVDEGAVIRILRMGIAHRVFQEQRPGYISHSAASRMLVDDTSMTDWIGYEVEEMWPAAEKMVDALIKWPLAEELNQTGYSLAQNTNDSLYAHMAKDAERSRRFASAMTSLTRGEGYSMRHIAEGYDWDAIKAETIVDMGGSDGNAGFAIARRHPNLKVIVQDLAVNIPRNEDGLNVTFMAHDFFDEQPVKDADVYLFRWVLHNWPDKYCIEILRKLAPALKDGARVLIMDFVMPTPLGIPNILDRELRWMDLIMMQFLNAKERELEEWKRLFAQADDRFQFQGVIKPQGSKLAILEIKWRT